MATARSGCGNFKRVNTGSHCCDSRGKSAMLASKMKTPPPPADAHKAKFGGGGKGGARPKRTKL